MRLIRGSEVVKKVGLSRITVWRMEREGQFPERRRLGLGAVGWLEHEIDEWIKSRKVVEVTTSAGPKKKEAV